MNTQVNWQKIRSEFNRLTDMENLKGEVQRIRKEIRNFDYQSVLSPSARQKVKAFEKRYGVLMKTIHQAQRQMDREFNRVLRDLKARRAGVDKVVRQQKSKLETISSEFQKRFTKTPLKKKVRPKRTKATKVRAKK